MRNFAKKALALLTVLAMLMALSVVAIADKPDTSAQAVITHGESTYNQSGTTMTATGYRLTAQQGDFDARVWVGYGGKLGPAVADGGLTIGFKAVMPQTNAGRVYYGYSGAQNDYSTFKAFVGLKPVSGGYKLLKNMSHEDATDEYYNDTVYTGTIAFMLFIEPNHFDVYANGDWVGEGTTTEDLSSLWYYAFKSYYTGNQNTKMEVKDMVYLKGAAITGGDSGADPDAWYTEEATEAPTTAPTNAPGGATSAPADPSAATKVNFDMSMGWCNNNGGEGQNAWSLENNTLTMEKTVNAQPFQYVFYCDEMAADTSDQDYTIVFKAMVESTRGYANEWDCYGIGFMEKQSWSNADFVGIDSDGSNGAQVVWSKFGGNAEKYADNLTQDFHEYAIVTNRGTHKFSVYVDGIAMVENKDFSMNNQEGNFFIAVKNGNAGTTNAKLTLKDMEIYKGKKVEVVEQPTPDPVLANKIRDISLAAPYKNGEDGTLEYADGALHLKKDKAGSNFSQILWANTEEASRTETTTLQFDAKGAGGLEQSWDGYAIALRYGAPSYADHEVIRMVPNSSGMDLTIGAGQGTIKKIFGTDYHSFSVVYNRADATVSVYCDGEAVVEDHAMTVPDGAPLQGFMIKSGHTDATNCELWLKDMNTWRGAQIRGTQSGGDQPTEAPTEAPTVKKGDMNGDNKLDAKDITLLRRAVTAQATVAEKPAGDWNGDNKLDAKDITLLRRAITSGQQ